MNALSDVTLSLGSGVRGLDKSVVWFMRLLAKQITSFGNHYFDLCFLSNVTILSPCFLPPVQTDSHQKSLPRANETLAGRSGHNTGEGFM